MTEDHDAGEGQGEGKAPHAVRLAWALRRGEAASVAALNPEKVVREAIALADAEGLKGLTIRRLGQRLGVTAMAIYRHVASRDELLLLMVDSALGVPPTTIGAAPSWPEAIRRWGQAIYAGYQRHPWLLDVPAFGLPVTPNHIAWIEAFLSAAVASQLSLQQQLDAALLIDGHARQIAHLRRLALATQATQPAASPDWLRQLLDASTYPYFAAVLEAGVLEDAGGPEFEFGLDCIVAGLTADAER